MDLALEIMLKSVNFLRIFLMGRKIGSNVKRCSDFRPDFIIANFFGLSLNKSIGHERVTVYMGLGSF